MKKSNLEMVRNYLAGERPVIQIGYEEGDKPRKFGEMWTDSYGRTWQQRNGYRLNINPQADLIRGLTKQICSACKKEVGTWATDLDKKLYTMTGKCADCQITEETRMRMEGTYRLYEKKKVYLNQLNRAMSDVWNGANPMSMAKNICHLKKKQRKKKMRNRKKNL